MPDDDDYPFDYPKRHSIYNGNPTTWQIVQFVLGIVCSIAAIILIIWLFKRTKNRGRRSYEQQQAALSLNTYPAYGPPAYGPPPVYEQYAPGEVKPAGEVQGEHLPATQGAAAASNSNLPAGPGAAVGPSAPNSTATTFGAVFNTNQPTQDRNPVVTRYG